LLVCCN